MKKYTVILLACLFVLAGCLLMPPVKQLTPCVNADNPLPLDEALHLPGTFIFNNDLKIIAVDGRSHTEKLIIDLGTLNESRFVAGMTPNGEWFGYFTESAPPESRTTVHLISSIGETISTIPAYYPGLPTLSSFFLYPIEWINSNLMLVVNIDVPVGLLDPFTGEWKAALLESLPNRYDQSGVAFSPDLSRALYVAGSASDLALILWDVERGRELWREENYNWGPPFEELPGLAPTIWSIDSSIVTFPFLPTGGQGIKIYAISRDGDNSQLIRPTAPDNRSNSHSWSPDDHYLAFVSRMTSEPSRRGIIIYDRLTNTSVDMCPLGEMEDASGNLETHGLIWSPDSRYLVYGMGLDVVDENNKIVMLDIYTGQVTLLQKGSRIWMEGWSSIDTWVNP